MSIADSSDTRSDALVARAFDRALDAERDAEAAIRECERQVAEQLEHARQQGRAILARTQARIAALHTRAEKDLEQRSARIVEQHRQSSAEAAERLADPTRRTQAIERLAARLTSDESQQ